MYMDKEPTLENSSNMTITKAQVSEIPWYFLRRFLSHIIFQQITTATVIDREDLEGNPNGFAIHVSGDT